MASMNNDKNTGKGAAEVPEPEPDDASSAAAAASYDPTLYQRPHPDDRGGDGKEGAAATKARDKTEDKSNDKKDDGGHRCANCDKPGATKRCGRCGVEWYCDHNCQKVGGGGGRVSTSTHPAPHPRLPHTRRPPTPSLPRSTTSAAATAPRAGPTSSPPPSTRSRSGSARRRWTQTVA